MGNRVAGDDGERWIWGEWMDGWMDGMGWMDDAGREQETLVPARLGSTPDMAQSIILPSTVFHVPTATPSNTPLFPPPKVD